MRLGKVLLTLALIVAFVGTIASAAQAATLLNEATMAPCASVGTTSTNPVSGGCPVHMVGEDDFVLVSHPFGIETTITDCASEFTVQVNSAGLGYVSNPALSPPGAGTCSHKPCKNAGGAVLTWNADLDAATRHAEIRMCLQPIGVTSHSWCTFETDVGETSRHHIELTADDAPCTGAGEQSGEVSGHWIAEATPGAGETEIEAYGGPGPMEALDESTGEHCEDPGCHVEVSEDLIIQYYFFGSDINLYCNLDLEGTIGEDGEGQFTSGTITPQPGKFCQNGAGGAVVPCQTMGVMNPWAFHLNEVALGEEEMQLEMCVTVILGPARCLITDAPVDDLGGHEYRATFTANTPSAWHSGMYKCKLIGNLDLGGGFEIRHPPESPLLD